MKKLSIFTVIIAILLVTATIGCQKEPATSEMLLDHNLNSVSKRLPAQTTATNYEIVYESNELDAKEQISAEDRTELYEPENNTLEGAVRVPFPDTKLTTSYLDKDDNDWWFCYIPGRQDDRFLIKFRMYFFGKYEQAVELYLPDGKVVSTVVDPVKNPTILIKLYDVPGNFHLYMSTFQTDHPDLQEDAKKYRFRFFK